MKENTFGCKGCIDFKIRKKILCGTRIRQTQFSIENSFRFLTSGLEVKNTDLNFRIGHRFSGREVQNYVLHAQCINMGKYGV